MNRIRTAMILGIIIMLILSLPACKATPNPEVLAATSAAQTVAAYSPTPPPTNTPVPTNTPIPTNTPTPIPTNTPTPTPTNTKTPTATIDYKATDAVKATQTTEAQIAQVKSDLEAVDITLGEGKLVLFDPASYDVTVKSYNSYNYAYVGKDLIATDFMMKVDIKWESTMGFAVCGIIFRGDKDIQNGSYYIFQAMRFSGLPAFDIEYIENGRFNANLLGKVKYNNIIDLKNGATNSYILSIAKGSFFVYANGKRIAAADSSKLTKGVLAYYTWQESGETTCSFSKAWVWALP